MIDRKRGEERETSQVDWGILQLIRLIHTPSSANKSCNAITVAHQRSNMQGSATWAKSRIEACERRKKEGIYEIDKSNSWHVVKTCLKSTLIAFPCPSFTYHRNRGEQFLNLQMTIYRHNPRKKNAMDELLNKTEIVCVIEMGLL